jgi:hypothetical protein
LAGRYYRELRELLEAAGCSFVRNGAGDHEIWYSPVSEKNFPVDKGGKNRHTANKTLKMAGLPKAF